MLEARKPDYIIPDLSNTKVGKTFLPGCFELSNFVRKLDRKYSFDQGNGVPYFCWQTEIEPSASIYQALKPASSAMGCCTRSPCLT